MAIKYEITKHGYAFPTNALAGKGGEHWLVFITKPGDAVIIRQVPEIAEQFTKKFEHEANYYNAKGEIVRGYRAHEGDTWELSTDLFDKTPEAKKTLTYAAGKWTVGA